MENIDHILTEILIGASISLGTAFVGFIARRIYLFMIRKKPTQSELVNRMLKKSNLIK